MNIFLKSNVWKRNLVSPISYRKIQRQLLLGNLCVTGLIWLLFVAISFLLYGKIMLTLNGGLLILNSLIFSITALAIGFLVGNVFTNKEAQNGIVNVLALGTSFICGAFVPQEMLGSFVLSLAHIFPSYWYIRNNNLICALSNVHWEQLAPIVLTMGIVLSFGLGIFLLTSLYRYFTRQRVHL